MRKACVDNTESKSSENNVDRVVFNLSKILAYKKYIISKNIENMSNKKPTLKSVGFVF